MLKQCIITFHCLFDHDGESAQCSAIVLKSNSSRTVFKFKTDVISLDSKPCVYMITSYHDKNWLINISDSSFAVIENPWDIETTAEDLIEMDGMDEYTAEELAVIIYKTASLYGMDMVLDSLQTNPDDFPPIDIQILNDDLPF